MSAARLRAMSSSRRITSMNSMHCVPRAPKRARGEELCKKNKNANSVEEVVEIRGGDVIISIYYRVKNNASPLSPSWAYVYVRHPRKRTQPDGGMDDGWALKGNPSEGQKWGFWAPV
eukprot:scaffold19235_cov126-Isochrysis_galbana.AAC.32